MVQESWQPALAEVEKKNKKKAETRRKYVSLEEFEVVFCSSNIPVMEGGLAFHFLVSVGD